MMMYHKKLRLKVSDFLAITMQRSGPQAIWGGGLVERM